MTEQRSPHIKPIETRHSGFRFRSRLEARWAIFFEQAGIPYDYESEGYEIGGKRYLPDFWLPHHRAFVEIKPTWPTKEEQGKAMLLAHYSLKEVVMLVGSPWFNIFAYRFQNYCHEEGTGGETVDFASYANDEGLTQNDWTRDGKYHFGWTTWMYNNSPFIGCLVGPERIALARHPQLVAAYSAAREARFDRSEGGRL